MFGAAVAYDEVKYKYTDLQSLVASCFATGQVLHKAYNEVRDLFITLMQSLASNRFALGRVLHKAYDEIIYKYIIYNFYTVHSSLQPTAWLLGKPCVKPTTKSKTFIFSSQ